MRIILTFFSLIISNFLFAQNNGTAKSNNSTTSVTSTSISQVNNGKKVHYVEKRTKPVQNNSSSNTGTQAQKKPVISKAENQNIVSSK